LKFLTLLFVLVLVIISHDIHAMTTGSVAIVGEKVETGSEKSDPKTQPAQREPSAELMVLQGAVSADSTASSVKFNYLFYLLYKLKYGEELPAELIDSDI
jgi:hypothetical protein